MDFGYELYIKYQSVLKKCRELDDKEVDSLKKLRETKDSKDMAQFDDELRHWGEINEQVKTAAEELAKAKQELFEYLEI